MYYFHNVSIEFMAILSTCITELCCFLNIIIHVNYRLFTRNDGCYISHSSWKDGFRTVAWQCHCLSSVESVSISRYDLAIKSNIVFVFFSCAIYPHMYKKCLSSLFLHFKGWSVLHTIRSNDTTTSVGCIHFGMLGQTAWRRATSVANVFDDLGFISWNIYAQMSWIW